MRSKKAQFQHVFTFILMILISGVVLIMGYTFINQLLGQSCSVEKLDLKNVLESDLKRYASYGSYHEPDYLVPCGAERICFIDTKAFKDDNDDGVYEDNDGYAGDGGGYNAIIGELKSPTPNSVFLIYDDSVEPLQLFSTRISVDGDVLCVNATSGRFRIGMSGQGRMVVLTHAS